MLGDDTYIGMTTESIEKRIYGHSRLLLEGNHYNTFLQNAYNKCNKLEIIILETIEYDINSNITLVGVLRRKEEYYINSLHPSCNIQHNQSISNKIITFNNNIKKWWINPNYFYVGDREKIFKNIEKR